MSNFYHEESPNPSKRCKFLVTCLKDVFSNCHAFGGRFSSSNPDEDYPPSDFEYDDEQEVVVSAIRSRAMEKLRKRPSILTDSFSWVYSPITKELYITPKGVEQKEEDEGEDFGSVKSCFSCSYCSSAASKDAFLSVKTSFSHAPSFNGLEFIEFPRRSVIHELCHCEGWPFGLCRKALLLPPLPKSPSESWSWRKGTKMVRMI